MSFDANGSPVEQHVNHLGQLYVADEPTECQECEDLFVVEKGEGKISLCCVGSLVVSGTPRHPCLQGAFCRSCLEDRGP